MIKSILISISVGALLLLEGWAGGVEKDEDRASMRRVSTSVEREEQNDVSSLGASPLDAAVVLKPIFGSAPQDIPNSPLKKKPEEEDMNLILGSSPPRNAGRSPIKPDPNPTILVEFPKYKKKQRSKSLSLEAERLQDDQARSTGPRYYSVSEGVFDIDL